MRAGRRAAGRQAGGRTGRQAGGRTGRQVGRQAGGQAGRHTDRQTDMQAERQKDGKTGDTPMERVHWREIENMKRGMDECINECI